MFNSFLYHLGSLKGNSVLWDGPGSRSGAAGKEGGFGVWGGGGAVWAEIMKSMSVPGAGLFHAHLRSPRDMGVGGAGGLPLSLNIFLKKTSPWTDPDSVNPDPLSMPR